MNLKQNLLTLLGLLLCVTTWAQAGTIKFSGKITDSQTQKPLGAVLVYFENTSYGMSSTPEGNFSIEAPAGNYTLIAAYLTHQTFKKEISLTANQEFNIELMSNDNQMNLVVVSAGRYEQNIGEVTVSMEVIQPKLIQDKNAVNIDEILQQTPGVAIVDDEPQIRSGSGYSFGAGSRVQVLVDNIPILSGDAGKPSWGFLPTENVSQVEIIKGASSVLYGSSALSGVINFRTAYPTSKPKTKVSIFHGFYSKPQSDSAVYWNRQGMKSGINFLHSEKFGKLDFVFASSVQYDDGHLGPIKDTADGSFSNGGYNPLKVDRYNAGNRARLNLNLRYRLAERLYIGLAGIYSTSNSLATLIWDNSSTGLYGAYAGSATRTIQQLYTVDPSIQYTSKKGAVHTLKSRWQSLDNNNDNNQGNFSDVFYTEYQVQKNWELNKIKNLTTTAGVVNTKTDARGELFLGGNPDGHNEARNTAAYFQVDKKIGERLNLSGGVRYEKFVLNNEKNGKPVFRAGANYKLGQATYLRASYGQGYRFPSIAEKFIVTGLGAIQVFANPDLKPETSYNAEIGVKQGFKIGEFKGFIDVAVFQQEFRNFIEFTFGQWTAVPLSDLGQISKVIGFKSLNTGGAKVQGAELSIMGTGKIRKTRFDVLAGYTYTKPMSTTPDYVYAQTVQTPGTLVIPQFSQASYLTTSENSNNHILKYRMQHLIRIDIGATRGAFNSGISFRSNSHMQNIDKAFSQLEQELPTEFNPGINSWRANHTKGDFVFDARIGYTFSEKHRIALIVNNVLNREYAIRPLAIEDPRLTMVQYTLSL
jgi:outer membrane receptor protein involved in Fe transport